jgi:hypothetical protein
MKNYTRVLAGVFAVWALVMGANVAPAFAQATTAVTKTATPPKSYRVARTASAPARDVGPDSTITGATVDDPRGSANSGLARVPGAPSAGSTGLGGH